MEFDAPDVQEPEGPEGSAGWPEEPEVPGKPAGSGRSPRKARSRRRLVVAAAMVVVVVVALVVWALWPSKASPVLGQGVTISGTGVVGQAGYAAPPVWVLKPLTVTSVSAVFAKDSAPAAVFFLVCGGHSGTGGILATLSTVCNNPALFHPVALEATPKGRLQPSSGPALAVGIVPIRPGRIDITGFKVTYKTKSTHTATGGMELLEAVSAPPG